MTDSVRRATLEDVERVAPLFDAYRQFYRRPPDPALAHAFLTDRLARGESVVLLAHDADGTAQGFAQLYPSFSSVSAAPIFVLNDLFVARSARRRGMGSRLLRAAAEEARRAGAVRLTLSTEITNDTAQRVYEALGWKRDEQFFAYHLVLPG